MDLDSHRSPFTTQTQIRFINRFIYWIPSSRSFCCHFQALFSTSSVGVSAFHPSTLLALSTLPHTCSISPSRRGANSQFTFTPVAFSKPSTTSNVDKPLPVPMLNTSTASVSGLSSTRSIALTWALARSTT